MKTLWSGRPVNFGKSDSWLKAQWETWHDIYSVKAVLFKSYKAGLKQGGRVYVKLLSIHSCG